VSTRNPPSLALVGATGVVGATLIALLEERSFAFRDIALLASHKSAGRRVRVCTEAKTVKALEDFDFSGTDIAFFCAGGDVSAAHATGAAKAGALVIDNTNAFRMEADVPLVVPQVNKTSLATRPARGIIANPNCSTIPLVRLLRPLNDHVRIESLVVSTYQAASGAGLAGIAELKSSARRVLSDDGPSDTDNRRFANPLGFNLVPNIDRAMPSGFTLEEQKIVQESRKILGIPTLRITATCVRVPVVNAHSATAYLRFSSPVERSAIVAILAQAEDVLVHDRGEGQVAYPTPRFLEDPNKVHVGRIRLNPDDPCGLWLWLIADNLRIGAALNALQIAEHVSCRTLH